MDAFTLMDNVLMRINQSTPLTLPNDCFAPLKSVSISTYSIDINELCKSINSPHGSRYLHLTGSKVLKELSNEKLEELKGCIIPRGKLNEKGLAPIAGESKGIKETSTDHVNCGHVSMCDMLGTSTRDDCFATLGDYSKNYLVPEDQYPVLFAFGNLDTDKFTREQFDNSSERAFEGIIEPKHINFIVVPNEYIFDANDEVSKMKGWEHIQVISFPLIQKGSVALT